MLLSGRFAPRALGLASALLLAAWTVIGAVGDAAAQPTRPQKAKLSLEADRSSYPAGGEVRLALMLEIEQGWHTNSNQPTFDYLIPTVAQLSAPEGWGAAELAYPEGVMQSFAFTEEPISVYDGRTVILAELTLPAEAAGEATLEARVRYQACNHDQCLAPVTAEASIDLAVGSEGDPVNPALFDAGPVTGAFGAVGHDASGGGGGGSRGLLAMLLLGLVGGLILNAMPCVLPVLSLKVFSMVQSGTQGRSEVVRGSLMTSLGILVSFWALGGAAAAARAAGAAAGWGVQFQEPAFVTFLAVVVVLFSLNLWGVFEVPLPWWLANKLSGSGTQHGSDRQGSAGHFTTGLFATLMATPCSAPYLGPAVAFALTQSAAVTLLVFTAVGLGMALPYLALAVAPGAARLLPKPGAWMDTLKGLMGFLLAGTAVWLFYVLSVQVSGFRLALIQAALLGMAAFLWLRHRAAKPSKPLRWLVAAGTVASIALALGLAIGAEPAAGGAVEASGRIAWTAFDRERAEALAAEGRKVFVDVTAAWCMTCKFNERTVLETEAVAEAFERHGVVPMKADWTNYDEDIRRFLEDHGRAGIPFYLLYRPEQEPYVFGELLTKGRVLKVLDGRG